MRIGKQEFDTQNQTYIMGIVNVTPDSFYDGGAFCGVDKALAHTAKLIKDGADIIDIGGESTRPGHTQISDAEEIERVAKTVEAVKKHFPDTPISIDTYKSAVAKAAFEAGADMLNDIWGLKYDKDMAALAASAAVPCCLTHNRLSLSEVTFEIPKKSNFISELLSGLKESLNIAKSAGIKKENIIVDPGIGFGGKTLEHNLMCVAQIHKIQKLGYPVLIGLSNKSVIGNVLGAGVEDRLFGTLGANMVACMRGAAFIRVHNVREHRDALTMLQAIRTVET